MGWGGDGRPTGLVGSTLGAGGVGLVIGEHCNLDVLSSLEQV